MSWFGKTIFLTYLPSLMLDVIDAKIAQLRAQGFLRILRA